MVEFDLFDIPGHGQDAQAAFHDIQKRCPSTFWTPLNGGHWVVTAAKDIDRILRDPETFSSDRVFLPVDDQASRAIPVEVDPPHHIQYRKPLNRTLFPKVVDELEPKVRALTNSLIDSFLSDGQCEFMSQFAQIFPIAIFLDLVDLPRSQAGWLVPVAHQFSHSPDASARADAQQKIADFLGSIARERRQSPRDDLLSIICNAQIDGERIDEERALAFATLVLFGGLDTVAGMLGFFANFLATHPDSRRQLVANLADKAFVKQAVEELLRRYGLVNVARRVTSDTYCGGFLLKKGDMVLPPNMLVGLDESLVEDPLAVRFDRELNRHAAFGLGPHACPGAHLARNELRIFLEEWLKRIPEFEITPGTRPTITMHVAATVERLEISWPLKAGEAAT